MNTELDTIQQVYTSMEAERKVFETRAEEYAKWTLPNAFPIVGNQNNEELQVDDQSIGAKGVNHLSNKIALNLFRPGEPFFRLELPIEDMNKIISTKQYTETQIQDIFSKVERSAIKLLAKKQQRSALVNVFKQLIITGNALQFMPKDRNVQVYTLRDYVIKRDIYGDPLLIITQDKTTFGALSESSKNMYLSKHASADTDDEITLYTKIEYNVNNSKFDVSQAINEIDLEEGKGTYTKTTLPWIPLVWNLARGRDYGSSHVEDYSGYFHVLSVLSTATKELAGILSRIVWLVDPQSGIDINDLNNANNGEYIPGKKDDITAASANKMQDWQFVTAYMDKITKVIGSAFLLNSAVTRDAERVTAEEMRIQAQELEGSLGGAYSRFAEDYQLPIAYLMVKELDINIGGTNGIEPLITTGFDALGRQSSLEALQLVMQDLSLLSNLEPSIRSIFKVRNYALESASARGVNLENFVKSEKEIQQEQAALQQQQQQQMAHEAAIKTSGE